MKTTLKTEIRLLVERVQDCPRQVLLRIKCHLLLRQISIVGVVEAVISDQCGKTLNEIAKLKIAKTRTLRWKKRMIAAANLPLKWPLRPLLKICLQQKRAINVAEKPKTRQSLSLKTVAVRLTHLPPSFLSPSRPQLGPRLEVGVQEVIKLPNNSLMPNPLQARGALKNLRRPLKDR